MEQMDEKIEKILGLIQTLPADQVVIIADKCKTMSEISPRVQKVVDLVNKLDEQEQQQVLNVLNEQYGWKMDQCWGISETSVE